MGASVDEACGICIIGAGSSGVAVGKALKQAGLGFDCFEIGSDLGGMWRYENDNGLSSAYRSLHIDTSSGNLAYSDFPCPAGGPDFLSHREVLRYLESYADHFGVRDHIRFSTPVRHVTQADGGGWDVTLGDGEVRRYASVVVANGHLWDPRLPDFPGEFGGTAMHSHHYRTAAPFAGQDVMVVGLGNSAVDIAVDVCKQAGSTLVSTRRSAWIMPKYLMGIPIDRWSGVLARRLRLPTPAVRAIIGQLMRLAQGNQERFGVPRPAHPIWREHATLSQELLPYAGHGWITIKPDVAALEHDAVRFSDGSTSHVDAIIYATGYRFSFPFLDPAMMRLGDGEVSLYRRMAAPDCPGLYFAGLVQPIGPTIPLVELQARWLAGVLGGQTRLPSPEVMRQEIEDHRSAVARRYVNSTRYILEVDFRRYARQMAADTRRGQAGR